MPVNASMRELRGFMAQIARREGKAIGNVSRFDINKMLRQQTVSATDRTPRYNDVKGSELSRIIDDLKRGPYPTHGEDKVPQFSFGFWYNYFYKELPVGEKLNYAIHVINDDGSFRDEHQVPDKARLFDEMLRKGFKEFTAGDYLTAKQVLAHAQADHKNEMQTKNVNVLFRGDGRHWKKIRADGGTKPQSRIEFLRVDRGMNRDWHPFNTQGDKVWLRNGPINNDNCLFSAVSVTPQFLVATKFPLLDDLTGSNPGAVGHAVLTVRDRASAPAAQRLTAFEKTRAKFAAPTAAASVRSITLMASQTNIYVVRMRDAYDTQKFQQEKFPEYASQNLLWADHLLWFSVTRIHFSAVDGNAGHLVVINEHRWLQQSNFIRMVLLSPSAFGALEAFAADIVARGALRGGVGGIVYTPPGIEPPPFEIVAVRDPFIAGRPPKATIPAAPPPRAGTHAAARSKVQIPDAFRH